jgi:succinate dehydrogenase / fumarate reductase, iron-sulfur subunit
MKERVVDRKYDPLVWLGSKIGLRPKDDAGREPPPRPQKGAVKRPPHTPRGTSDLTA